MKTTSSPLWPYTTLFRSESGGGQQDAAQEKDHRRSALGPLLSGTGRFDAGLRHRNDAPRRNGRVERCVARAGRRGGAGVIKKVRSHPSQNEALLFERSSPGKGAWQLPELDV